MVLRNKTQIISHEAGHVLALLNNSNLSNLHILKIRIDKTHGSTIWNCGIVNNYLDVYLGGPAMDTYLYKDSIKTLEDAYTNTSWTDDINKSLKLGYTWDDIKNRIEYLANQITDISFIKDLCKICRGKYEIDLMFIMKYILTSGKSAVSKVDIQKVELTTNVNNALQYDKIGDAIKMAIRANSLVGHPQFKVFSIENTSELQTSL